MAIAQAGYHVIIGDRATEMGIRAVESIKEKTGNMNVEFVYLDLGSFKDIRSFVQEVERRTSTIDLLINSKNPRKCRQPFARPMVVWLTLINPSLSV